MCRCCCGNDIICKIEILTCLGGGKNFKDYGMKSSSGNEELRAHAARPTDGSWEPIQHKLVLLNAFASGPQKGSFVSGHLLSYLPGSTIASRFTRAMCRLCSNRGATPLVSLMNQSEICCL